MPITGAGTSDAHYASVCLMFASQREPSLAVIASPAMFAALRLAAYVRKSFPGALSFLMPLCDRISSQRVWPQLILLPACRWGLLCCALPVAYATFGAPRKTGVFTTAHPTVPLRSTCVGFVGHCTVVCNEPRPAKHCDWKRYSCVCVVWEGLHVCAVSAIQCCLRAQSVTVQHKVLPYKMSPFQRSPAGMSFISSCWHCRSTRSTAWQSWTCRCWGW